MKILSMDGGGIRGLLTTSLLKRLTEESPGFLSSLDKEDLVLAGTSTGGIAALGIAAGLDMETLVGLYRDQGKRIFAQSMLDKVSKLDELIRPDFDAANMEAVLEEVFEGRTLGDAECRVLVTTFDLQRNQFKVMDSACPKDKGILMRRAARRTSAAPTYFKTADGCVDGGIVANDPIMCAVFQLLFEGHSLQEMTALSVGTGAEPPRPYPFQFNHDGTVKDLELGLMGWAPRLLPLMFGAGLGMMDYFARILRDRYHKLNPPLSRTIDLADIAAIPELLNVAQVADLEPTLKWIRDYWMIAG